MSDTDNYQYLSNLEKDAVIKVVKMCLDDKEVLNRILEKWGSDIDVVKVVLKKSDMIGNKYISSEIKANKKLMMSVIKKYPMGLMFLSQELKSDKRLVLIAVKKDGMAIKYASEFLKKESDIVEEALKSRGLALMVTSEEVKSNRKLVEIAVNKNPLALAFASVELQDDREFLKKLRERDKSLLVPSSWKSWFNERMKTLEILEEEDWMIENIKQSNSKIGIKKF